MPVGLELLLGIGTISTAPPEDLLQQSALKRRNNIYIYVKRKKNKFSLYYIYTFFISTVYSTLTYVILLFSNKILSSRQRGVKCDKIIKFICFAYNIILCYLLRVLLFIKQIYRIHIRNGDSRRVTFLLMRFLNI